MTQFDSLNNKMFFNILINDPDTSVIDFVAKYFPNFAEKRQTNWTIYPPDTTRPIPYKSEHNFIFDSHAFFKIDFQEGKLELHSIEAKNYLPRLQLPRITFSFVDKKQASIALDYFKALYEKIGCKLKTSLEGEKEILIISDSSTKSDNSVGFVLYKDILDNKYRLLFSFEGIIMTIIK